MPVALGVNVSAEDYGHDDNEHQVDQIAADMSLVAGQ